MKFLKLGLMSLSIILLLSACVTTDKAKKEKAIETKAKRIRANLVKITATENDKAKKFAVSQAENYYKALKNKDYKSFYKSKKLSKKDFNKWHNTITKVYGTLKSQSYIGSIANPLVIRYMWKWNFSKKVKGKTLTREALYNVFIAKDKKKNKYILFATGLQ
jgi:hypothetical protein